MLKKQIMDQTSIPVRQQRLIYDQERSKGGANLAPLAKAVSAAVLELTLVLEKEVAPPWN